MKYLLFYGYKCMITIGILSYVYGDEPPQKTCHELKAVRRKSIEFGQTILEQAEGKSVMLWKATKMVDYYHNFGTMQNFCSVFHFGPDCRASRQDSKFVFNGLDIETTTDAIQQGYEKYEETVRNHMQFFSFWTTYNEKTNNFVQVQCETKFEDPNYIILDQKLEIMDLMKQDTSEKIVTTPVEIPESLKQSYRMYATIAVAPHYNWFISRTCDKKITWVDVLIDSRIPLSDQQNILDGYKNEVNKELIKLDIDLTTMTDFLPLEFPFDVPPPVAIEEEGTDDPWIIQAIEGLDLPIDKQLLKNMESAWRI